MSSRKKITEAEYEELLRDGLSSHRSYIVLKQKARSPVYLCFKPVVQRMNAGVVYFGGKLSAFPDKEHEKWNELTYHEQEALLCNAFPKLPKDRRNRFRCGSHAGFYIAAASGDGDKFWTKFDKGHVVQKLLDEIESTLRVTISNRAEVAAFLTHYYVTYAGSEHVTETGPYTLRDRQIGKRSKFLLGQAYLYTIQELVKFCESIDLESSLKPKSAQAA